MPSSFINSRETVVRNAASEPHVQDLCSFLVSLGARIQGIGTQILRIEGVRSLSGGNWRIGTDHIEVGSMIGLAAWQVRAGDITLGDFILINQFMIQLFLPLGFLGFVFREIKGSLANIEKMFELMAIKPRVVDAQSAAPLQVSRGDIVFSDVYFGYNPRRGILQGVSFEIGGSTP